MLILLDDDTTVSVNLTIAPKQGDTKYKSSVCDGCYFQDTEGSKCSFPADRNTCKCWGSCHADCQDRIYIERSYAKN